MTGHQIIAMFVGAILGVIVAEVGIAWWAIPMFSDWLDRRDRRKLHAEFEREWEQRHGGKP